MFPKQILFSIIFSTYILAAVGQAENQQIKEESNQQTKVEAFQGRTVSQIEPAELPEGLQRTISLSEFSKWEILEAYQIHESAGQLQGQASFILVVKRRETLFALYYDLESRLIRQELMDMQETSIR
jgi:hypothetical protein